MKSNNGPEILRKENSEINKKTKPTRSEEKRNHALTRLNQSYVSRNIWIFFSLTFAWTWAFWGLKALLLNNIINLPVPPDALKYIGGLAPISIALLLTYHSFGKKGTLSLLKRGIDFKFAKKWWIPLLLMAIFTTFTAYQLVNIINPIPNITIQLASVLSSITDFLGGLIILLLISVAEEFGWRGYALDRLQAKFQTSKYTAIKASIILGIIWACWHIPLFFTPGEGKSFEIQYFPLFLVMAILLAISFTWFHNNSNGSILAAIVFHTSINSAGIIIPITSSPSIPSYQGYVTLDSVILLITIIIIAIFGAKTLVRNKQEKKARESV